MKKSVINQFLSEKKSIALPFGRQTKKGQKVWSRLDFPSPLSAQDLFDSRHQEPPLLSNYLDRT